MKFAAQQSCWTQLFTKHLQQKNYDLILKSIKINFFSSN
jgi:hypothetical protein